MKSVNCHGHIVAYFNNKKSIKRYIKLKRDIGNFTFKINFIKQNF